MIINILLKVLGKSSLASPVVLNLAALDPQSIVLISKDSLRGKVKTLLHHLISLKIMNNTFS